jgi:roadblock/LC7 domain-containing protein
MKPLEFVTSTDVIGLVTGRLATAWPKLARALASTGETGLAAGAGLVGGGTSASALSAPLMPANGELAGGELGTDGKLATAWPKLARALASTGETGLAAGAGMVGGGTSAKALSAPLMPANGELAGGELGTDGKLATAWPKLARALASTGETGLAAGAGLVGGGTSASALSAPLIPANGELAGGELGTDGKLATAWPKLARALASTGETGLVVGVTCSI